MAKEQRDAQEEYDDNLEKFKQLKFRLKSNFTRVRRNLLVLIDEDHPSRRSDVQKKCQRLYSPLEAAMNVMENQLSEECSRFGDGFHRREEEILMLSEYECR